MRGRWVADALECFVEAVVGLLVQKVIVLLNVGSHCHLENLYKKMDPKLRNFSYVVVEGCTYRLQNRMFIYPDLFVC